MFFLQSYWHVLNIFHYVSVRAILGLLSALFFSILWGDYYIQFARRWFRSKSRPRTPQNHRVKDDLPTMGGLFMLAIININVLLWCDLSKLSIWLMLFVLNGFGAIGALDDWQKITKQEGISARAKCGLQALVACIAIASAMYVGILPPTLMIPFMKGIQPDFGWIFIPWSIFILVGASNGVNLTDGLDGLAIESLLPNFALFSALCYLAGHAKLASYLLIPFAGTAEIAIAGAIILGACLGFLWYNAYPAQIFMGDVGSLALGGALGFMAILCKQEILLALAGGIFVAETISVILQVGSYRIRGKKIFRMAPMHHHFELLGWHESKITTRFGIISLILCLLAAITIKMR